jgi:hypothetical protein
MLTHGIRDLDGSPGKLFGPAKRPKARRKFKKTIILQALKKQPFIGPRPVNSGTGYANDGACCTLSEATFS